jgi:hypothetical protein
VIAIVGGGLIEVAVAVGVFVVAVLAVDDFTGLVAFIG